MFTINANRWQDTRDTEEKYPASERYISFVSSKLLNYSTGFDDVYALKEVAITQIRPYWRSGPLGLIRFCVVICHS
jgi:hypothetical protein